MWKDLFQVKLFWKILTKERERFQSFGPFVRNDYQELEKSFRYSRILPEDTKFKWLYKIPRKNYLDFNRNTSNSKNFNDFRDLEYLFHFLKLFIYRYRIYRAFQTSLLIHSYIVCKFSNIHFNIYDNYSTEFKVMYVTYIYYIHLNQ